MQRLCLIGLAFGWLGLLAGCNQESRAELSPVASVKNSPDVPMPVIDLAAMERVTEEPYLMEWPVVFFCTDGPAPQRPENSHFDYYCHVYVTANGLETMRSGQGAYPVGTEIVKAKYADKETTQLELFTRMKKMPAGYDSDHGDWEYSVIDRNLSRILSQGKLESCINCHQGYEERDFVSRLYLLAAERRR